MKNETVVLEKDIFLTNKPVVSFRRSLLIFDDCERPFLDKIHILVGNTLDQKNLRSKIIQVISLNNKKHLRQHS